MKADVTSVVQSCGLDCRRITSVQGGDINEAYCIDTGDKKFFLKMNSALRYPGMFLQEAAGLAALKNVFSLTVPSVIQTAVIDQQQFLLLEWIEKGTPAATCWTAFGTALAAMHAIPQSFFGWEDDNFIGTLVQKNTPHQNWSEFYSACRILPLVKTLYDKNAIARTDVINAERFCNRLQKIFPAEHPSLLHGDLWSGNYMIAENGHAAIYDPAVYYGHREMDIAMTKLFGGFPPAFYEAYHAAYPLETGWQQRLPAAQLYPLLVHAVLFGGHYISSAMELINDFA